MALYIGLVEVKRELFPFENANPKVDLEVVWLSTGVRHTLQFCKDVCHSMLTKERNAPPAAMEARWRDKGFKTVKNVADADVVIAIGYTQELYCIPDTETTPDGVTSIPGRDEMINRGWLVDVSYPSATYRALKGEPITL